LLQGGWPALLAGCRRGQDALQIDWKELNNRVLHIEALNSDALGLGFGLAKFQPCSPRAKARRARRQFQGCLNNRPEG